MLFTFGFHSALLLPFVVPGLVAVLWLLGRGLRSGSAPDVLLALLIALPTLSVAQWMLGYAGWYDSHDAYSTVMFYLPWQPGLLLGPAYYLYFRSLANQEFSWRRLGWHLVPGLAQVGLWVGAAGYDLLWFHGLRGQPLPAHFGTKGPMSQVLESLSEPLAWLGHALLLAYGLRMLADYRRYRHYLDDNFSDPERLRFAGLRQLLLLQLAVLALNLIFSALDTVYDFSYNAAWNFYALRGVLIYGLIVVGIQANYAAAASSLRFEAEVPPPADGAAETLAAGVPHPNAEPDSAPELLPAEAGAPPASVADKRTPSPSGLAPELHPWREKLLRLMADEQPWLEPELTLTELAHRLRTHPALLSKVINAGFGQNFNDFVNTYRVAEARRKLADPRFAHYSLVGVALESGFNSKSTFNRVFRKLSGHAPSEVVRPKS
jgi:AraC-like DNA-binding protein